MYPKLSGFRIINLVYEPARLMPQIVSFYHKALLRTSKFCCLVNYLAFDGAEQI